MQKYGIVRGVGRQQVYGDGTLRVGAFRPDPHMPAGVVVTHSLPKGNHCHVPRENWLQLKCFCPLMTTISLQQKKKKNFPYDFTPHWAPYSGDCTLISPYSIPFLFLGKIPYQTQQDIYLIKLNETRSE